MAERTLNLYVISEDERDDVFYAFCAEKITGRSFTQLPRVMRRGGGNNEVKKGLKVFLSGLTYTGHVDDTFFIVSLDNDRAPHHPDHTSPPQLDPSRITNFPKRERDRTCRVCELNEGIELQLGDERSAWPIQGAVAVPQEMLESWLLLVSPHNAFEHEAALPLFSLQSSPLAKRYFGEGKIPPQLKDLVRMERLAQNISKDDYILDCAANLDPELLATQSPSFKRFKAQLEAWF